MPTTAALSLSALKRLPDKANAPDLISVPETARRIGLHADTLYRLCRTGRFSPAIHIGGRWRVSVPRLERYLHDEDSMSDEHSVQPQHG
jgi:excisionase family DNA binding protein